ncbi:MAG: hypothetical protein U1F43_10395 [Myxococcota bacterium]
MTPLFIALLRVVPSKPPTERPALKLGDDVVLSDDLREVVRAIAQRYHEKTKRTLEITSGVRSPERQAGAMYTKLVVGGSLAIYKRQALTTPILKAYRDGRKKKHKKEEIVKAMAAVIADQVAHGDFISRHLKGRAFDARLHGLTGKQRQAFLAAAKEVGGVRVLIERHPPHFHVELLPKPEPAPGGPDGKPDEKPDEGPDIDEGER